MSRNAYFIIIGKRDKQKSTRKEYETVIYWAPEKSRKLKPKLIITIQTDGQITFIIYTECPKQVGTPENISFTEK